MYLPFDCTPNWLLSIYWPMVEVAYNTSYGRISLGEVLVHLTAVALMAFLVTRINQVVNTKSRISYLWNFGQIAKEDAAEERINWKYSEHESTNRKTSEDFATQYPLFGLDAMNRIDQASGKLIMQKYFQLLTTIIWHVKYGKGGRKKTESS